MEPTQIDRRRGRRAMNARRLAGTTFVAVMLAAVALVVGFADTAAARDSVLRIGGSVVVPADEQAFGEVVAFGGTVEVLGEVVGDVVAVGGSVTVDGTVSGDVIAVGGTVRLGPAARVLGDVTAVGGSIDRHPGALVQGEVHTITVTDTFRFGPGWRWMSWEWPWWSWPVTLLYVAGLFALASIILAWFPDRVHAVEQHMETNAGRSVVIGLIAVVLLIPLTLVLVLTIIGPPLLWLGYFAAKMMGYVALVSLVGRKVAERFFPDAAAVWQLVAGVLIVALLRYVPVFGGLFSLAVTVWTVGAVLDTKFGSNRPWIPPRQA